MSRKMLTRIGLGTLMIVGVAGLLWLDWRLEQHVAGSARGALHLPRSPLYRLPTAAVLLVLTVAGFRELSRLAMGIGAGPLCTTGLLAAAALVTRPYWAAVLVSPSSRAGAVGADLPVAGAVAIMLIFAEQMVRYRTSEAFRRVAATVLAVGYLGVCGSLILEIRRHGVPCLVLFLAVVKFTDIGAYFTGSAIGRHKLIPWLSPGKSWEGLAGGLAVAAGVGVLVAAGLRMALAPWQAAVFALIVGLTGQFGDLCESLLKRSAGVKDSGALVPEFGGVLDIIDSPLMAAVPAAVLSAAFLP